MKIVVFGDVHGNLPALELMVDDAKKVDQYICLGDVVNYGPWSNECVQFIAELGNCIKIKGNHEDYFIDGKCDAKHFLVQEFFSFCYDNFEEKLLLKEYKKASLIEDYLLCHTIEERYIYHDSIINLENNYFIGHSHQQFKIESNGYVLYNPGSVGQNRQFINEINYMIYDTKSNNVDFRSLLYDVDIVIKQMSKMSYPEICLDYYRNKPRK